MDVSEQERYEKNRTIWKFVISAHPSVKWAAEFSLVYSVVTAQASKSDCVGCTNITAFIASASACTYELHALHVRRAGHAIHFPAAQAPIALGTQVRGSPA
ncbi:hypothetical protein EVAR_48047_1 [Eumeta japonica]|uniref:Uncharacterized protein n=1 Tax=Eumeta variegata TaxID=151549 RepID=A0A4C1XIB3_EUMVA|nr:hypothetical protein EVAR_48047_1 [Eumeta japonica]